MDVEIVSKFLSTLSEDDSHSRRIVPWRPQTIEWDANDLNALAGEIPSYLKAYLPTQH
uniref:U650y n=1 Tax=Mycobacterium leprae TaxID=1769 RepID=Q50119_MYCLR|nr:u650y [Mycobacterium leprae]